MILLLAAAAHAAAPELVFAGKPFQPATVIAMGDPAHPGILGITATTKAVTCAQAAKQKVDFGSVLLVTVNTATGDVTGGVYVGDKAWGPLSGTGKAGEVPAVGKTGTVTFDLATGDSSAKGTLSYVLCTAVEPSPPLTITADPGEVDLGELKVAFDRPAGWAASKMEGLDRDVWKGPDGYTTFSVYDTCGGDCVTPTGETARKLADEQAKAFVGVPPWTLLLLANEAVGSGAHVLRYELGQPGLGSSITMQMWRWDPSWSRFVVCEAKTVPWRAATLDALQQACLGLTVVK